MDLTVNSTNNIEGDKYIDFDQNLILELDSICKVLKKQMSIESKRILVSELRQERMSRPYVRQRLSRITNVEFNSYLGSAKQPVNNDYSGIYLFGYCENRVTTPVYVGISRNIVRRLSKHFWSTGSNSDSWMYRIAKKYNQADKNNHRSHIKRLQEDLTQ